MLYDNGYCRISSLNETDQAFIEKYITMALASPSLILSWCFYFVRAKRPLEPERVFRTLASVFGVQALTWLSCYQLGVDWAPMPVNKHDLEALENMENPRGYPIPM